MEKMKEKRGRQKRVDRYSVLLSVSNLLTREVELDSLLKRILDQVIRVLDAQRATIYFVDLTKGELFSRAAHLPELREIRLKIGQGIAGHVAKTGRMVNYPGKRNDVLFFADIDEKTGFRTKSMITVPVRDRAGVIFSVLQVLNKKIIPFDKSDEQFLRALAAQLGIILENTSLYPQIAAKTVHDDIELKNMFNTIIAESPVMKKLLCRVGKAAAADATVLLRGESGTGKEILARAVHCNSPRADRPFVKIDCAALPESLIENELFGHAKGAYTGAHRSHDGKFVRAAGGTAFIDEIGELPASLQPKLLRFLQDRRFEQLGGTKTLEADVRVIAATNRNTEEMVARGLFREDLYYRIKVVQLDIPPLRERGEADILALAAYFLHLYAQKHGRRDASLSEASKEALVGHAWPGNVRELQHCIESALIMSDGSRIDPSSLSLPRAAGRGEPGDAHEPPEDLTLEQVETAYIDRLLKKYNGNRSKVARVLDIGRNTLHRKIRKRL
ncbi:MAG: sigma-54-dependent Fis family transcriptional regulator, partial [Pseudomonadota bacterium]